MLVRRYIVPVMLITSTTSVHVAAFSWLTRNLSNKNHKLAFNVSQAMELNELMYCNSFPILGDS